MHFQAPSLPILTKTLSSRCLKDSEVFLFFPFFSWFWVTIKSHSTFAMQIQLSTYLLKKFFYREKQYISKTCSYLLPPWDHRICFVSTANLCYHFPAQTILPFLVFVKFTSIYIDYEFHAMSNLQPSSSNEVLCSPSCNPDKGDSGYQLGIDFGTVSACSTPQILNWNMHKKLIQ